MITLLSIGKQQPCWIDQGVSHYQQALPKPWRFEDKILSSSKALKKQSPKQMQTIESKKLFKESKPGDFIIVCDPKGESLDSLLFAEKLKTWHHQQNRLLFMIGAADGFDPSYLDKAHWVCSLSKMTFAHGLARLLIAEQIFRAWSIIHKHPYHRY
jgi:23S rRNA (pseudouridine1915-N3)-methyltransferase